MRMKKTRFAWVSIALLLALNGFAQTGNVEAIVCEVLEQLPAENNQEYRTAMERLASTGKEGILQVARKMVPADKGENARFEYAISGLVDYVLLTGNKAYRTSTASGLTKALEECTDNPHKAYLMSELQKCASAKEFRVFSRYLNDPYLQDFAISGIAKLQGAEKSTIKLIKSGKAPHEKLAYLAYFKQLNGLEKILLGWLPNADERTTASIYAALSACGSSKSLKLLEEAARKVDFKTDATGATDAYLRLKERLETEGSKH